MRGRNALAAALVCGLGADLSYAVSLGSWQRSTASVSTTYLVDAIVGSPATGDYNFLDDNVLDAENYLEDYIVNLTDSSGNVNDQFHGYDDMALGQNNLVEGAGDSAGSSNNASGSGGVDDGHGGNAGDGVGGGAGSGSGEGSGDGSGSSGAAGGHGHDGDDGGSGGVVAAGDAGNASDVHGSEVANYSWSAPYNLSNLDDFNVDYLLDGLSYLENYTSPDLVEALRKYIADGYMAKQTGGASYSVLNDAMQSSQTAHNKEALVASLRRRFAPPSSIAAFTAPAAPSIAASLAQPVALPLAAPPVAPLALNEERRTGDVTLTSATDETAPVAEASAAKTADDGEEHRARDVVISKTHAFARLLESSLPEFLFPPAAAETAKGARVTQTAEDAPKVSPRRSFGNNDVDDIVRSLVANSIH